MKNRYLKNSYFAFVLFTFLLMAFKEDNVVKSQDLDKLIGTWVWKESSGGFTGQLTTPSTAGYIKTIKFKKNGIYKIYKNGKLNGKMRFTLAHGTSIYKKGKVSIIKYKDIRYFVNTNDLITESYEFGGEDTLIISEECYDCFTHIFIRQK